MNTKKYSSKQEKRVALLLGGKVNSNSGATDFFKGDVRTKNMIVECKTSIKPVKSTTIKKEWLQKLQEESFSMGRLYSSLAFDFGDGEDYFIINKNLMKILMETIENE